MTHQLKLKLDADLVWDDLRVFLYVMRSGQIQLAAKALGVDHSTVSRKLLRLEERIGVPLFERAARRLRITEEGLRLAEITAGIEATILREVQNINENEIDIHGRVRIGAPQGLGIYYLASRLPSLIQEYADLEVELCALPRTYSLASREADIVITMDRPSKGSLRFKKLTSYYLGLYASEKYLSAFGTPVDLENLQDHIWCGYIAEFLYTPALDLLSFGDVRINPTFRSVDVCTQVEAICSGTAMGVLPCFIAEQRDGLVRLLGPEINIKRPYYLVVHEDLANIKRVRLVMEKVEGWIKANKQSFLPEIPAGQ